MRVAVGTVANVDLPLHDMLGALIKATTAEALNNVASVSISDRDRSVFSADAKHTEGQTEDFKDLHGPAYESLCAFMRKREREELPRCSSRFLPFSSTRPRSQTAVDWRDNMVEVENGIGGWSWVLRNNKDNYCLKNGSR